MFAASMARAAVRARPVLMAAGTSVAAVGFAGAYTLQAAEAP
eukprot:SAG22_NODE_2363_length_2655_cov_2.789906_1_plen_42_part_00